jgi:hypothetical protein
MATLLLPIGCGIIYLPALIIREIYRAYMGYPSQREIELGELRKVQAEYDALTDQLGLRFGLEGKLEN